MNPNIKEIGNVVKQMQVIGMTSNNPSMNAPKFNQAAADIVTQGIASMNSSKFNQAAADIIKQGIDQKQAERKWGSPFKDNNKPL